jgi:hypothetical protein
MLDHHLELITQVRVQFFIWFEGIEEISLAQPLNAH